MFPAETIIAYVFGFGVGGFVIAHVYDLCTGNSVDKLGKVLTSNNSSAPLSLHTGPRNITAGQDDVAYRPEKKAMLFGSKAKDEQVVGHLVMNQGNAVNKLRVN
jgi:hypothetical protein